ncbi:MAG: hypothetical protein K2U26_03065 [Cyclobacteriaceae bacterium]|nr:hypothetical protein [Cyclobacteriaceae bacterium]
MNPFYSYAAAFLLGLLTCSLGWSKSYPPLSYTLALFILLTIAVHIVLGRRWQQLSSHWKQVALSEDKNPIIITAFIYVLWAVEFIYEGGVPLVKIMFSTPYNYRLFGVPSLHVFAVTFASFYTVYLFHLYLSTRKRLILFLYLINLVAALLIYNRGMLLLNLSSSIFLYWLSTARVTLRSFAIVSACAVVLLYFFGVLGTIRISREAKRAYDSMQFLEIGKASETFRNSIIPYEYFWAYIYMSASLANLQENIDRTPTPSLHPRAAAEMINNELLFDFISKRINKLHQYHEPVEHRIEGPFNATTIYSKSYSYLGWWGILLMAVCIIALPGLYQKLLSDTSPFFLSGIAILCTVYAFMVFDNTLRFTGLGFQLVYPILFTWMGDKNIFRLARKH